MSRSTLRAHLRPGGWRYSAAPDRAPDALEMVIDLATELLSGLEVTSDRCDCCGQHTQPAKAAYQAQKQLESIIRQADRLLTMESDGLLPWKERET